MTIEYGGPPQPQTGTGNWVRATSPTLVTPVLGVATGTSLALGGATIGTDALAVTGSMSISGQVVGANNIVAGASSEFQFSGRSYLGSPASAVFKFNDSTRTNTFTLSAPTATATPTIQFGALDAAAPVAQTLSFQNGSGSNIAAVNATIVAPLATGNATNGDLIFQTGVKVASGTGAATKTTALIIKGETQALQVIPGSGSVASINFGTTNTGLYGDSGSVKITAAGINAAQFTTLGIFAAGTNAAALSNTTATATNPTVYPNQSDFKAGIGANAAGNVSIIANNATVATEMIRVTGTTVTSNGTTVIASGKTFQLGNAAVTGLTPGALAALTTATIVILDSTGQAYRIPCVI